MTAPTDGAPLEDAAPLGVCPLHDGAAAVATCDRCGCFVCDACQCFYDYRPLCPACMDRRTHNLPASTRAKWAMVLGVVGVGLMVLPFGIPAAIIGHTELAAIRQGTAPAGGKGYATAGVVLGWLNVVFFLLIAVAFALIGFGVWLGV